MSKREALEEILKTCDKHCKKDNCDNCKALEAVETIREEFLKQRMVKV